MAWSTDPQEPERIPRAGWYATPTVLQPPAWAEWYDPYQERAGNDSGVGTLTATVKQIERVTANFGGAGAFTPGASSTTQYVAAAFDNYDTSATGYLYSGLSAWGWAVRTVAAALSGLGTTWVTTGDHVDGLSATTAEQYLGQPGIAQPSIGTLIGSVFQKYPAAGSFSSSSALSGEVHTLGGFPDGLSAYAFPESDVIGFEDSEGQLDGVIYQIYTGVAPPFASQGALTASVVPRRDSTPALTGFGILTLTTVMQMVRTAALSNIGTLAATTSQIYTLPTVTLAGTGSLSGQQVQGYTTAVQLTGTGNLSGQTQQGYAVAGNFTGFGTLIPTHYPGFDGLWASAWSKYAAAEIEDGTGTLSGSVSQIYSAAVQLAGAGSLSATARMYQATAISANTSNDPSYETYGTSTAYVRTGTKSVLTGPANGINYWGYPTSRDSYGNWIWKDCTPGQQIYMETWVYGDPANVQAVGTGSLGLAVGWMKLDGTVDNWAGSISISSDVSLNGKWTKMSTTVTVPDGYYKYCCYVQITPLTQAGEKYYWDDSVDRPLNLLQGGGTLSPAYLMPQRNSSLTLTGTGALAATVVAQYPCATALTGAGALTSTSRMYQIGSAAALSASGALTATRTSQYYEVRSVALSGGGSLSAVASPVAQRANITIDPGFESSGNSTAYARNGTKSSVLVADGIGWQSTRLSSGWVECTPGQVIYGEVWFLGKPTNVQSGLDAVGITLAVQDTTGVNPISYPGASFVTSPGTTNGVWNKIAYTLTVPAGYNQYIPYFWVHINATAGDTYYFDDPIVRPSNLFQGGGSLTATVVGQRNAAPALSGAGALSGTTTSQYNASVALTGSGALAATYTSQYYAQTAASLTGSGTLSATAVAQYLTNPSFGGGGTLSATAVDNWTPYNEENVAVTGGTVPSGASGCYVTIIGGGGGGGKANARSTSPYTDYGGGGGGGGGKVARVWIPKASLGATYTVEVGGGGAGGFTPANGTRSYFTSGSVTLTANGGTKGANATTSAAGSAGGGGTASASGVTATTYNGASGSNGSSGTAIAGSASANAGAGGGGGGGGTNTLYFSGGAGGSANGGAIAGGTANGGTPSDAAAGIGGAGGGGGGTNGNGLGGNGGKYGGGAGGGGHGTTGRGGTGGAGYTKVEWV